MTLQNLVHNWLLGGADPEVGLRLFLDYVKPALPIARIVSKHPARHVQAIRVALLKKADLPLDMSIVSSSGRASRESQQASGGKIRSDWPFLSAPECPPELKLLISDKITAYRNCIQEYGRLPDAATPAEQLNTARALVTNFIANHEIYRELKHYKDTGKVLGEHKIFAQYKRIKDLRNHNTMDLFKK